MTFWTGPQEICNSGLNGLGRCLWEAGSLVRHWGCPAAGRDPGEGILGPPWMVPSQLSSQPKASPSGPAHHPLGPACNLTARIVSQ